MDFDKKTRPGRKIAAEKRRIAREILKDFIQTEDFLSLDRSVQLAIYLLCPSLGNFKEKRL